ncbi:hypothetical protein HKX48_008037 [Thoreauomyces humboldtii]|nr:hypothetical protein HKX48_008037 [Thoreauomyces humboldtii]
MTLNQIILTPSGPIRPASSTTQTASCISQRCAASKHEQASAETILPSAFVSKTACSRLRFEPAVIIGFDPIPSIQAAVILVSPVVATLDLHLYVINHLVRALSNLEALPSPASPRCSDAEHSADSYKDDVVEEMFNASDLPDLSDQRDLSADEDKASLPSHDLLPNARAVSTRPTSKMAQVGSRPRSRSDTSSLILPSTQRIFGSKECSRFKHLSSPSLSPSLLTSSDIPILAEAQSIFSSTELSHQPRPRRSQPVVMATQSLATPPLAETPPPAPTRRRSSAVEIEMNPYEISLAKRFLVLDAADASTQE